MKKLFLLLTFAFLATAPAKAAPYQTPIPEKSEKEEMLESGLCKFGKNCKALCDLKIADKYDDKNSKHLELTLRCAEDVAKIANSKK